MKTNSAMTFFGLLVFILSGDLMALEGGPSEEKCEQAWDSMIRHSSVGDFTTYRMTTNFVSPQFSRKSVSINKSIIEEATTDKMVTRTETTMDGQVIPASKHTTTKVQFMKACNSPTQAPDIIEEGSREVTVPAGTFACTYRKMKLPGTAAGAIFSETYMASLPSGHQLLVKSESESEMAPGMKSFMLQELLEYSRGH